MTDYSELLDCVDKLLDMYDASPSTMEHIAKRYPALHHSLENVMVARTRMPKADVQPTGLPDLTVAGEIRPGAGYLLSSARAITPQEADRIQEVLHARFPGSAFVILTPGLTVAEICQLVPLTRAELANALERTESRLLKYWGESEHGSPESGGYNAVMHGLRILVGELAGTPERDGAAAPPAVAPADESATPTAAPSPICGKFHPRFMVSCSKPAAHQIYDPQHHDADAGVWWE